MWRIEYQGGRVETGAVQFGQDVPGLFIRGGDCIGISTAIKRLLETIGADSLQRDPVLMESLVILNELREAIEKDELVEEIILHVTRKSKGKLDFSDF
jgi:hypothetical protein